MIPSYPYKGKKNEYLDLVSCYLVSWIAGISGVVRRCSGVSGRDEGVDDWLMQVDEIGAMRAPKMSLWIG